MRPALATLLLWLAMAAAMAGRPARAGEVVASAPTDLSVTLYRAPLRDVGQFDLGDLGGFALVSETRTVTIPAGESRIRFEGVADGIDPASAILTGLPSGVLEKDRVARLLSPSALVALTVGRPVQLVRRRPKAGQTERVEGRILSDAGGVVFEGADGAVEALRCSGLSETFSFDIVTPGLSARPTLSVLTRSPRPLSATVTLSYLADGFDWAADYVAMLAADGRTLDLGAWLTLANGGGASFHDARVQVVAGRLDRRTGEVAPLDRGQSILAACWPRGSTSDTDGGVVILSARRRTMMAPGTPPAPSPPSPPAPAMMKVATLEQLGDLKLYRAPERTTVAARQAKQVRLFDRRGTAVERVLEADLPSDGEETDRPATLLLRTRNDAAHHLGLPLPSGRMAILQAGPDGPLLLGETAVRDLAEGEAVEWRLGEAPDVRLTQAREPRPTRTDAAAGRVTIANASGETRAMELRLRLPPGAALARSTPRAGVRDGRPIFRLVLPPRSTTVVRYEVREPPAS